MLCEITQCGLVHMVQHAGVPEEVLEELRNMGHTVVATTEYDRFVFGRGQIIRFNPDTGVSAGALHASSTWHALSAFWRFVTSPPPGLPLNAGHVCRVRRPR